MASLKVDVAPDVLIWARESIGLSREEAAKRLGMSLLDLRYFEEGVDDVPLTTIGDMANVYKRPQIVFFLPTAPALEDILPDFRLSPDHSGEAWSPELHGEYRRAVNQRRAALEVSSLVDAPQDQLAFNLDSLEVPEISGERVRAWLGAPPQFSASFDSREIFNAWVELVEQHPIMVMQVSGVETSEMRGFSIDERPWPVIAINNKDVFPARSFTLMHELVHVLLGRGGLCDMADDSSHHPGRSEDIERYCNATAAAILIPKSELLRLDPVRLATRTHQWGFDDLRNLGRRFGVSAEAMLLRLVSVGKASSDYYWEKRKEFFAQTQQTETRKAKGGNYYFNTIHALGRRYISAIWEAYKEDVINEVDVSRYLLGVKQKHLETLIRKAEIE